MSKVQCRNLVTNTPTKDGIRALLKATTSVNKTSQNGFKLGGVPTLVQDQIMYSMGAKQKGWVQKFYDKYGFRAGAKAEQELLRYMKSSKFETCGIPVGVKEMIVITPEYAKPLPNAEIIKKEFCEKLQQSLKNNKRSSTPRPIPRITEEFKPKGIDNLIELKKIAVKSQAENKLSKNWLERKPLPKIDKDGMDIRTLLEKIEQIKKKQK